jgi:hypothetical protein
MSKASHGWRKKQNAAAVIALGEEPLRAQVGLLFEDAADNRRASASSCERCGARRLRLIVEPLGGQTR